MSSSPLIFAHIGDLHITKAKEQNYIDLLAIVAQIETDLGGQLDFVILPGDNADNGLPEQYKLVSTALKMLSVPIFLLAGDHDMEQGSLQNFYQMPNARQLPMSVSIKGNRCLFIDVCGRGSGGPDFRIGEEQFTWLEENLTAAHQANEETILFMHTFPADLKEQAEKSRLNQLIDAYRVTLVEMGHTHYNEIANDGQTIFTATRSTGQIEEGPVGYSIISVHDGAVSWRFKNLADPFPFVLITSPVDHRLLTHPSQLVSTSCEVAALVFGSREITGVACQAGPKDWAKMDYDPLTRQWRAHVTITEHPTPQLTVKATDETGRPGQWIVQPANGNYTPSEKTKDGSDSDTIGAWPENGIFGTQLGPNRNGKPS